MSDGYKPRKGSLAEKVLAHLAKKPAPLTSTEVAALFAYSPNGVGSGLKGAIEAGALQAEKNGRTLYWSLPGTAAPRGSKKTKPAATSELAIACYNDGDVNVNGVQLNEDESVTFTREQIQQLVEHVTQPHIATRAAALQG